MHHTDELTVLVHAKPLQVHGGLNVGLESKAQTVVQAKCMAGVRRHAPRTCDYGGNHRCDWTIEAAR